MWCGKGRQQLRGFYISALHCVQDELDATMLDVGKLSEVPEITKVFMLTDLHVSQHLNI